MPNVCLGKYLNREKFPEVSMTFATIVRGWSRAGSDLMLSNDSMISHYFKGDSHVFSTSPHLRFFGHRMMGSFEERGCSQIAPCPVKCPALLGTALTKMIRNTGGRNSKAEQTWVCLKVGISIFFQC